VRLAVEVLGLEELGDLDDRVTVDEDRPEHGLLGLDGLRRQTIDHGRAMTPGLAGRDTVADGGCRR
jgi:hypothetical protein